MVMEEMSRSQRASQRIIGCPHYVKNSLDMLASSLASWHAFILGVLDEMPLQ